MPWMDQIFNPLLSCTTPSPPKFNVNVTSGALANMDEENTSLTFFLVTRELKHCDLGFGVQQDTFCRDGIFCPSTVSVSDVLASFGFQTMW